MHWDYYADVCESIGITVQSSCVASKKILFYSFLCVVNLFCLNHFYSQATLKLINALKIA